MQQILPSIKFRILFWLRERECKKNICKKWTKLEENNMYRIKWKFLYGCSTVLPLAVCCVLLMVVPIFLLFSLWQIEKFYEWLSGHIHNKNACVWYELVDEINTRTWQKMIREIIVLKKNPNNRIITEVKWKIKMIV